MFTGLIEELGRVGQVRREGQFQSLDITARNTLSGLRVGDSVNIDGACQTVVDVRADSFSVQSVEETLKRTTLGEWRPGRVVNLERALRPHDRLGGHLVLGHVDGVGRIGRIEQRQQSWILTCESPRELERYVAPKGSIAVDGISLTVVEARGATFTVSVIPHTFDHTTLGQRGPGDRVNLEVDIIARYVERLLATGGAGGGELTLERLREMGY